MSVGSVSLIRHRVLKAFREHFVSSGVFRSIEDAFATYWIRRKAESAEEVAGQRRHLVEECYRSLDLSQKRHPAAPGGVRCGVGGDKMMRSSTEIVPCSL